MNTSIDWRELTKERKEWVDKNFPPDNPDHSKLGMIEECGELVHHYLKKDQGIRGTAEDHDDGMKDSVGDLVIYMLGVMWHGDFYPDDYTDYTRNEGNLVYGSIEDLLFRLDSAIAKINDGRLSYIVDVLWYLYQFCKHHDWDFEPIVINTWARVSKRDWTKNKQDGGEGPSPDMADERDAIL
jgi:NTP pyrophosphatase (non-canonical NTP hydrolase)